MVTTSSRIRRADPAREVDLPDLDARARTELRALTGSRQTVPQTRRTPRPTQRWVVTGVVAAVVIVGSVFVIGLSRPAVSPATSPTSASGSVQVARRVAFEANTAPAARYEQALEQLAFNRKVSRSAGSVLETAVAASPQLRVQAEYGSTGSGSYTGTGTKRFALGSSDDSLGGNGTGADAIDVYAMRCTGAGLYKWRVLGHTVGSTRTRVIATATGACGAGMTAARYITRGNVIATTLEVDVPRGRAFGLADIGYANFGSSILDSAYPTD